MPESVKISELPELSTVKPDDIIPVVDEFMTQTSRATAAQVCRVGGGPPGDDLVEDQHMSDGSVLPTATGFSAPDRIAVSTSGPPAANPGEDAQTATGASDQSNKNGNYSGKELICTPYMQGLFAQSDGPKARAYLDSLQSTNDAVFTGQTRFPDGTPAEPSICAEGSVGDTTGKPDVGIYFETSSVNAYDPTAPNIDLDAAPPGPPKGVGIGISGYEVFRATNVGLASTTPFSNSPLPFYGLRAWCTLYAEGGGTISFSNARQIGSFVQPLFSFESLAWTTPTVAYASYALEQRGWNVTFINAVAGDGRTNYTSPGDNTHLQIVGAVQNQDGSWDFANAQWQRIPASGTSWIGAITASGASSGTITGALNIESVASVNSAWRFYFTSPMPIETYAVFGSANNSIVTVPTTTRNYVDIYVRNYAGLAIPGGNRNIRIGVLL
jgi:hypothetical protein